jgi:ABC-type multidrug transport system fused ATPase/permease subunit
VTTIQINLCTFFHSYFIKDGIISEAGTHDELLGRDGDYSSFVRLQALEMTTKT